MLQIFLYGPLEEGFLDIDPAVQLDMEGLSPLFDEDLSTGEFSLPLDLEWTERNRRLFGFAERLENFNTRSRVYRCDVYDDGFPELLNAQLTILERSGSYSYRRGKFSVTIAGTQGLFGTQIKNKKMSDLQLGGVISWSNANGDSRAFATQLMKGQWPQYADRIAFAPVAIQDFIDASRPDYDGEFLVKDTVNNIIVTGGTANDWTFGRPRSTDAQWITGPGDPEYADYWTVPFLRLSFVIRKIFEEHGYKVSGDFIDGTAFRDLHLFNQYAIENYARSINTDFNREIDPRNHVPPVLIADFLKQVFSPCCIYPRFINQNEVQLVYRKDDFQYRRILKLDGHTADDFNSTYEDVEEEKKGYEIKYEWDAQDGYYGNLTKDLSDKTAVGTVATTAALQTLNIGRQLTTDDIAFVEADNLWYRVANATVSPVLWDVYAEGLYPYKTGKGERSVSAGCSTLCTHAALNTQTALVEKYNYLGTKQRGSYRNFKGVIVKNEFAVRVFYIQKRIFGGVLYPVSFYHNRDQLNTKFLPFSLALNGEDGLVKNFHQQWQDLRQRGELVKTTVALDKKLLAEMDAHNTYEVNGVLFLPQKLERTIPLSGEAELTMMPL